MKYILKKQTRAFLPSAGQYVARAVHTTVMDTEEIASEIQENCTLKRSDVLAVLSELEDVLVRALQRGDIVKLNHLGRLKLEIEGRPVADRQDFCPDEHIRGVRLHLIPESRNGCQRLYDGIRFGEFEKLG